MSTNFFFVNYSAMAWQVFVISNLAARLFKPVTFQIILELCYQ